jgi:ABC-2 type transport system permease protein
VGLGACLPNFRESDPSKIAVGFGGTLNLVAGLLLLVVVIVLMAGPWHLQLAASESRGETPLTVPVAMLWGGLIVGMSVGIAAVILPLRAGMRALRGMEF